MVYKVGIYPGTFDPPHEGHLAFAREAVRVGKLDEVLFLPEILPRGKPNATTISKRVALLEEAIRSVENARVVQLEGGQFTVRDTLPRLREFVGESELTLLLGSDIVQTFSYRWEDLEVLLSQVSLAIGMRSGVTQGEIILFMEELRKQYRTPISYRLVSTEYAGLSSSQVRKT